MLYFQNYVPTVFENYTASFEIDKHRIELNMWDTSGKTFSSHHIGPLSSPDCGRSASNSPLKTFFQLMSLWQIALTFPASCRRLLFLIFFFFPFWAPSYLWLLSFQETPVPAVCQHSFPGPSTVCEAGSSHALALGGGVDNWDRMCLKGPVTAVTVEVWWPQFV